LLKDSPEFSIVIVNWNSADYCADCIASVYASEMRVAFEIIVIDNASFDGCDRMLASRFPEVRFVQGKTNAGFARANNQAYGVSMGKVICFLNPDTLVRGRALQSLFEGLMSLSNAGAVGALLFNRDGTTQTSCVLPFPTVINQALDFEWLRKRFPEARLFGMKSLFTGNNEPQSVEAISGACIMVHRDVFNAIGGFSPEYFMYAEDIDLCHKIRLTGKKVFLIKDAEIVHFGGGSSVDGKSSLLGATLMRESNFMMLRKFKGLRYALLYRFSLSVMGLIRIAALMVWLLPAIAIGRGRSVGHILQRWWRLFEWSLGIHRFPLPIVSNTVSKSIDS
jgi:N-acetylglucosaminyl-diphospho-decaprenol L-rhamnosyltransferase